MSATGRSDSAAGDAEELQLLRQMWDFVWNRYGEWDCGDHVGVSYFDAQKLSELAGAVEDHYVKRGFPSV